MKSYKMTEAVYIGNKINEELIINNEKINNINAGADASVRPEHKGNAQKGITLLALIITIIVLLILSVVSVQLITKSGIIEKAKLATLKHEIAKYDEELKLYIVAHREEVNKNPINTSGYENMKKYIPSFKKKYEDKLKISNNKLVYMNDNVSDAERELFNNAGIGSDEMTQIYYLDENNKEQVLEINDAAISETSYTSKNIAKENITTVIIGSSCKKIETSAFENCTGITSVTIDTTNTVAINAWSFKNCSNLVTLRATNVSFPLAGPFENCTSLQDVELGSKEHMMEKYITSLPFSGCLNEKLIIKVYMNRDANIEKNLKSSNNATIIQYNSTGEENNIVIGLKYKGTDIAWESLSEFEEIKNADKITEIRNSAFEECKNLKIAKLPTNLVTIGDSAFKYCESIKISEIPKNITSIGAYAFQNCTSITSLTIDTTNTVAINAWTFKNCSNLLTLKATNVSFPLAGPFENCTSLQDVELGSKEHMMEKYITSWVAPFSGCPNEKLIIKVYMNRDANIEKNLKTGNNATIIILDSNGNQIN